MELKTSPLKVVKSKLASKERLVLNIIDYISEASKTFETSSFWRKNRLLLLLFYLHDSSKMDIDLLFKICRLWEYPEADLKIIRDDWSKIVTKIRNGQAHLLSEADTLYLAACTKGATAASSMRSQPYSPDPAKQRAFSLKSKYLNFIIDDSLKIQSELAVKSAGAYRVNQTFE
ncbi:MAG TPA: DNA mismatch repair protein, partial [Blastocatellia bacterium]|nr:DNA mismatch repair protein [Blastocatellia bacterium]